MKVFGRNPDGTRGRLLADLDDEVSVRHGQRQLDARAVRERAADRLRAVRLRLAFGTFGRGGGAHRESRRRGDRTRLLYRLISG
jgi:hypothetical protein